MRILISAFSLMVMLSACGNTKHMEIKEADVSDIEKNRMKIAAPHSFGAEVTNINESISEADMYIEHYQNGKLVETIGPITVDYTEENPDTLQFVYFENEEEKKK